MRIDDLDFDFAKINAEIRDEIQEGRERFGDFRSFHEAYAVLLEEVDEVWARIKAKDHSDGLRHDLTQVAAITARILLEFERLAV